MPELLIYASIVFLAASIHGTTGFGFPMIATPLLTLVTDIQTAIVLTLIPTFVVYIASILSESGFLKALRKHFDMALLAGVGGGAGTLILLYANSEVFELLLAFAIIFYLLATRIRLKFGWIRTHARAARVLFGFSAGVLGGLTNVMAPVMIIYSVESQYSRKDLIQASNICFLFGKVIQLIIFSWYGRFTFAELSASTIALVAVSFALALGIWIRKQLSPESYMRILRGFLWILALMLILKRLM